MRCRSRRQEAVASLARVPVQTVVKKHVAQVACDRGRRVDHGHRGPRHAANRLDHEGIVRAAQDDRIGPGVEDGLQILLQPHVGVRIVKVPRFHEFGETALVAEDGVIVKHFYPVFPSETAAEVVLAWLREQ